MANIIDFSKFFSNPSAEQSSRGGKVHFLGLKQPFRLLVVGPSGCGKTNYTLNLMLQFQKFDSITYVAMDIYEDKLQGLQEFLNFDKDGEMLAEPPLNLISPEEFDDSKKININSFDRAKQHLMVFDDSISYPKSAQDKIADIFIRGRKLGISSLLISHRYFDIPRKIRMNATSHVIFRLPAKKEEDMICADLAMRIDKEQIRRLLREATAEPFGFLWVDHSVSDVELPKHIRKGYSWFFMSN